jgi:serine/threonine protein kinase
MDVLRLLAHKNIVRVIDELIIGNVPLLVLEFIQGEVLERVAAGKPLTEDQVVDLARQLLEAIDYIHSMNLIHRDIAPKNVFASKTLKLIDFGTAKFFYSQAAKPEAVVSPGGYTAPEQYRFASSPQGDLWSAGATMFYACTGQPPLLALGNYPHASNPADPWKFNRKVGETLRQMILKATQADPTRRFATAREMLMTLDKGKVSTAARTRLVIKNEEIPLEAESIILGRMEKFERSNDSRTITPGGTGALIATQDKCELVSEGNYYLLKIPDPLCYISRRHAEIFYAAGGWYVRDLGSLNKTAIYSNNSWTELWKRQGERSQPFRLSGGEWISLAYDVKLGPYLTALFRTD